MNNKLVATLSAAAIGLAFSTVSLASDYKINLNNKTSDTFTIYKNLSEYDSIGGKDSVKVIDLSYNDKLELKKDRSLKAFAISYDKDHKRPKCSTSLSDYKCAVSGSDKLNFFNVTITK